MLKRSSSRSEVSAQGLTWSGPDSGVWELSDAQLVVDLVLSLFVVGLCLGVDSVPDVVCESPADEYPEGPVSYLGVQDVGVDVKIAVSLEGTDSSVPVSCGWKSAGVGSEACKLARENSDFRETYP